ncbi:MAG: DinB family protein [Bacteroidota bacterium]
MKEILLQFAKYNVWANKRIIDVLLKLEEEQLDQELVSSFATIRATVYHIWSAELIWLERLQLTEQPVWAESIFKGTFQEACKDWERVSDVLAQFIDRQYDDKGLEHVFQFYDRKKQSHKSPVYTTLNHVFNHSTYHRGQLITMLRQVGVKKLPSMDLVTFAGM